MMLILLSIFAAVGRSSGFLVTGGKPLLEFYKKHHQLDFHTFSSADPCDYNADFKTGKACTMGQLLNPDADQPPLDDVESEMSIRLMEISQFIIPNAIDGIMSETKDLKVDPGTDMNNFRNLMLREIATNDLEIGPWPAAWSPGSDPLLPHLSPFMKIQYLEALNQAIHIAFKGRKSDGCYNLVGTGGRMVSVFGESAGGPVALVAVVAAIVAMAFAVRRFTAKKDNYVVMQTDNLVA